MADVVFSIRKFTICFTVCKKWALTGRAAEVGAGANWLPASVCTHTHKHTHARVYSEVIILLYSPALKAVFYIIDNKMPPAIRLHVLHTETRGDADICSSSHMVLELECRVGV